MKIETRIRLCCSPDARWRSRRRAGRWPPKGASGGPFAGNIGNALWTLVIFGLVVLVLGKFAWEPILAGLQRAREVHPRPRSRRRRRDRDDAEARLKEYAEKLNSARARGDRDRRRGAARRRSRQAADRGGGQRRGEQRPSSGPSARSGSPRRRPSRSSTSLSARLTTDVAGKILAARDQPAGPRAADPRARSHELAGGSELIAWPSSQDQGAVARPRLDAEALFGLAASRGARTSMLDELDGLVELLDREPTLAGRAARARLVENAAKRALIEKALRGTGERPAGRRAPGAAQQGATRPGARSSPRPSHDELDRRPGTSVEVRVTSAVPLSTSCARASLAAASSDRRAAGADRAGRSRA